MPPQTPIRNGTFDFVRAFRLLPESERLPLLVDLGLLDLAELEADLDKTEHEWHVVAFGRARERETIPELAMGVEQAWRTIYGD